MKELLNQMKAMEQEMESYEEQADYWTEEEHFDEAKAEQFSEQADVVYEALYKLFDKAAEKIVSITSGQVDKITAMKMIRCRRADVERIFA